MDLRKLKTLIDFVSESNLSEVEIMNADGKVRIVKANSRAPTSTAAASNEVLHQVAPTQLVSAPQAEMPTEIAGHVVKSPMVGRLYRSSSPGTKPLANLGQTVKEGDTICIIEAMKIMNEIKSEKPGIVKQVLCENSQAVEFGQPLFVIE